MSDEQNDRDERHRQMLRLALRRKAESIVFETEIDADIAKTP